MKVSTMGLVGLAVIGGGAIIVGVLSRPSPPKPPPCQDAVYRYQAIIGEADAGIPEHPCEWRQELVLQGHESTPEHTRWVNDRFEHYSDGTVLVLTCKCLSQYDLEKRGR